MSREPLRDARISFHNLPEDDEQAAEDWANEVDPIHPDYDPDYCEFCGRTDGSHRGDCTR